MLAGLVALVVVQASSSWTLLNWSEEHGVSIYAQPSRTPNSVWVRMEFENGIEGLHSERSLQEVDCDLWRRRDLQITAYIDSNLTGESFEVPTDGAWEYPVPDSLGESVLLYHCDGVGR